MIIYSNIKSGFINDLPHIPSLLKDSILKKLEEDSSEREILSWKNSLRYMAEVINSDFSPEVNDYVIHALGDKKMGGYQTLA